MMGIELHFLLALLMLASLVGLLGGALLVLCPQRLVKWGGPLNRWISTRKLDRALERTISLDRWFYRHHRASGLLILLGAAWSIGYFIVAFDKSYMVTLLSRIEAIPDELAAGLVDGFVLIALSGAVFAALVSLFLLLRPSLLREFEQGANQWISTRRALQPLEVPRGEFEQYVLRHYRQFGLLLLCGGLLLLGVAVYWFG